MTDNEEIVDKIIKFFAKIFGAVITTAGIILIVWLMFLICQILNKGI